MEIRVRVVGEDEASVATLLRSLHNWLDPRHQPTLGVALDEADDTLVVELLDVRGITTLALALSAWQASRAEAVQINFEGGDNEVTVSVDPDLPEDTQGPVPRGDYGIGIASFDDSHAPADASTPPGPVLDPGDDWPRE